MKLPPEIARELATCGLPWALKNGGKHSKVIVGGRFCAILPKGTATGQSKGGTRAVLNVRAQIRRTAAELRGTP